MFTFDNSIMLESVWIIGLMNNITINAKCTNNILHKFKYIVYGNNKKCLDARGRCIQDEFLITWIVFIPQTNLLPDMCRS